MLKILVDENIVFAESAFNEIGEVKLLPGRNITNSSLKNIDILIVRSVTKVDEELLKNTSVKFVGTATIGTDHIDLEYLKANNIYFADAKGCNAYSVAEYIIAALLNLAVRFDFKLQNKSIGIVGVGNVGSKVASFAKSIGMQVLFNDPPLKRNKDTREFVEFDEILKCDVITLHTPLNLSGIDKTLYLLNQKNLDKLENGTILINSSRGAVINNLDLLNVINNKNLKVVLDVWENEPSINEDLIEKVSIATPHIAGYSYEGKVNGTKMIYESLCKYLNVEAKFEFNLQPPINVLLNLDDENKFEFSLNNLISKIYSIQNDNEKMKKSFIMNKTERTEYFDFQRKEYPIRREFNNYTIKSNNLSEETKIILNNLRFNISI
ncbi:MAG: 4-phosphoerythronate dehydrogenase [Ignavibacteriaceae bacterium]